MAATLGQLLVEKALISDAQLAEAIEEQNKKKSFIGTVISKKGWIDDEELLKAMSEYYGMPYIRLQSKPASPEAIKAVPMKVATHFNILPVKILNETLTVAVTNPQDIRMLDDIRLALHQKYTIETVLASERDIEVSLKKAYGMGAETIGEIMSGKTQSASGKSEDKEALVDIGSHTEDASVVKLVNQLILEAHQQRATDIHLEPFRGSVRLRYRIDGILQAVDVPKDIKQLFPAIVSRVKVISNLNIVERRLPQDGRASVKVGEEKLDLRIAILPTPMGESVVIRILPSKMLLTLNDLGYGEEALKILTENIAKPHGMIFVTGPTGSGKTTTLYACLNTINSAQRKIITLEDPIEYELEGVTQVQVKPDIGLSFSTGLRSMLRHDPDVMMVGEVRDTETVELAVRIALTGHLVFSTLHTNDAVSSLMRLSEMGVDPYLIASSCECIVAQRLVRLLCNHCKRASQSDQELLTGPMVAEGCDHCNRTGFFGREAVYEILRVSGEIRKMIVKKESIDDVRVVASRQGMRTMRELGEDKVKQGLTSMQEVLRVTQEA